MPDKYLPLQIEQGMTISELRDALKRFPDDGELSEHFTVSKTSVRFAVGVSQQVLCVRCAATVAEEERLQRALREVLPPNLRLYDFGDSQTVMPIPDFEGQGTYLTSSICYLEDPVAGKYLGVELRYNRESKSRELLDTTNIIEQLTKAVPTFEEKAVAFKYASDREHRVR